MHKCRGRIGKEIAVKLGTRICCLFFNKFWGFRIITGNVIMVSKRRSTVIKIDINISKWMDIRNKINGMLNTIYTIIVFFVEAVYDIKNESSVDESLEVLFFIFAFCNSNKICIRSSVSLPTPQPAFFHTQYPCRFGQW